MRAVLQAQINKTDRNDARSIAQMMRVGLYRPVHVKTLPSQKLRMLLTHRKLLQWRIGLKALDPERPIREADITKHRRDVRLVPLAEVAQNG
jgi:hypothetical protein